MNNVLKKLTIGQTTFMIIVVIVTFTLSIFSLFAYRLMYSATDDLIKTSSKEFTSQLILNYESYMSGVIDISNQIQRRLSNLDYPLNNDDIEVVFESLIDVNRNLRGVALFDSNTLLASSSIQLTQDIQPWIELALSNEEIHHFKFVDDRLFVLKSFTLGPFMNQTLTLLIELDKSQFDAIAFNTNLGQYGHILLLDDKFEPIYSVGEYVETQSLQVINKQLLGMSLLEYENQSMALNVSTIRGSRWMIATFVNVNAINQTKSELLFAMIGIILAMMLVVAYVSANFSGRLNSPMRRIQQHIQKIQEGNFDEQIVMDGQIEMVKLADTFNTMSSQIKQLMENVVEEQQAKRASTIKALQNQINPHFLYNTLDSIVNLSENQQNEDVVEAILALSKFFRMSISNNQNIVPLKDEIEHVRNYGLIQKIRYKRSFDLDIDVDETLHTIPVLKFCLQPLVENAIMHGLHPDMFTRIKISATMNEDSISLSVYNEGYGLSPQKIEDIMNVLRKDLPTQSVGLKNVYQRMKLYYGPQAHLRIESDMDEYTNVILTFPLNISLEDQV
jgi:two-component system sensor histidine kinase YesM